MATGETAGGRSEPDHAGGLVTPRSRGHPGSLRWSLAPFATLIIVTPVVWRLTLLSACTCDIADARGIVADLVLGTFVAIVATALARLWWVLGGAVAFAWSFVSYAIAEHVLELDAHPLASNLHFLGDPTFMGGSGLAVSHPFLLVAIGLVGLLGAWLMRRQNVLRLIAGCAVAGLVGVVLLWAWPVGADAREWRRRNGVIHLLETALLRQSPSDVWATDTPALLAATRQLRADLGGTPRPFVRPDADTDPPNVLLLVLEGVSGVHLESIAARDGFRDSIRMPFIDELAQSGVRYVNVVTQQRQTNRGTYALLAGRPPRLLPGDAWMTRIADSGTPPRPMLPRVLTGARGYETVYVQSAPLAFMHKDAFMPLAGFSGVIGDQEIRSSDAGIAPRGSRGWGVDDGTLLRFAVDQIERLNREPSPWFATVLTAGTHHPYHVPASSSRQPGESVRDHAFRALDDACRLFFDGLRTRGLLESTLVIVTSDESAGRIVCGSDLDQRLAAQCGFAIILTPEGHRATVTDAYAQFDVPISILDYVGIETPPGGMCGRSMFRSYSEPRALPFGHTYSRSMGLFTARGTVVWLEGRTGTRAIGARLTGKTLYDVVSAPPSNEDIAELRAMALSADEP